MKILKGKIARANEWHDTKKVVEGQIVLIDRKTLQDADTEVNKNGYLICVENEEGKHIVCPDTIEIIN